MPRHFQAGKVKNKWAIKRGLENFKGVLGMFRLQWEHCHLSKFRLPKMMLHVHVFVKLSNDLMVQKVPCERVGM